MGDWLPRVAAWALTATGLAAARRRTARHKATILSFPRILPAGSSLDGQITGTAILEETFRDQLQRLSSFARFIGLRQFCAAYLAGESFSAPVAVVTFENGLIETFDVASPILREMGIPATVFLPTERIGTFSRGWEDRISRAAGAIQARQQDLMAQFPDEEMPADCEFVVKLLLAGLGRRRFVNTMAAAVGNLPAGARQGASEWFEWLGGLGEPDSPAHLTWTHVKALFESGWGIGSAIETADSQAEADSSSKEEVLSASFKSIREITGQPPVGLTYPGGEYDEATARMARRIGYLCALTQSSGHADAAKDLFTLLGIRVTEESAPNGRALEMLLSFNR